MHYTVRHLTRFRYAEPIRESVMEVIMQPRAEGNQRLLSFALQTNPRAHVLAYNDHLGNIVHHFDILKPHRELLIEAQSQVEVSAPRSIPDVGAPEIWAALEPGRLPHEEFDMLSTRSIARQTPLLSSLMAEHNIARLADPLSTFLGLSRLVHDAFDYDVDATKVDSPIDHALAMRKGVCQDFSHIVIAMARALGIPARYVSGYLHHRKELDERPLPDATHAWVEGFIPGLGWIGLDPTNGVAASERHIRVAVGLDYNDVPPTRGVFKGKPDSELAYAVSVHPTGSVLKPAERLRIVKPLAETLDEVVEEIEFHQMQQ
jgi:transglutaminase-like putative cysteine protease